MAEQQQPFVERINGSTTPVQLMPDGTAVSLEDDAGDAIIIQGQAGPEEPITPAGVPLDFTVPTVQQPYGVATVPGVQRA